MTSITTWTELAAISMSGSYTLENNLTTSDTDYATVAGPAANGGAGWAPLGSFASGFTGTFDYQGFSMDGLTINRPTTDFVGLFAAIHSSASVIDPKLTNVDVIGKDYVGALSSYVYSASSVSGAFASGDVKGQTYTGGLVGVVGGGSGTSTITYSGTDVIVDITASGSAAEFIGGFVGYSSGGSGIGQVYECYAWGDVVPTLPSSTLASVGGFIGRCFGDIDNCYAWGDVKGKGVEAGFCGGVASGGTIDNSYSIGTATGPDGLTTSASGFCDENSGTVTNCFWDATASGNASSVAGTSKTTTQMQTESTFTGVSWDFTTVWKMVSYPRFVFESTGSYIDFSNNTDLIAALDGSAAATINFALKPTDTWGAGTGEQTIIDMHDGTDGILITYDSGDLIVKIDSDTDSYTADIAAEQALWDFAYNAGTVKIYKDAVLVDTLTGFPSTISLPTDGYAKANATYGKINIYDTELGLSDIQTIYASFFGVSVPNIVGLTQAAAESAITSAGLVVGLVSESYSFSIAAGYVISQTVTAGSIVSSGDSVGFTVSLGNPSSVITLRRDVGRALTYTELNTNFYWLKEIINLYLDLYRGDTIPIRDASVLIYNNSLSGMTATNVQDALDELEARIIALEGTV